MFTPIGFYQTFGPDYDSDAQAFFDAVEGGGDTLTTTEKDATNQLVLDLKADSLWTNLRILYPFVGGTSSSTKWNLKNPEDSDAAYRITWSGTATFEAAGITGVTNFFGNTHFNTDTWTLTRYQGVYCNVDSAAGRYDMGCNRGGVGNNNVIIVEFQNNSTAYYGDGGFLTTSNSSGKGHVMGTITNSGVDGTIYLNGTSGGTNNAVGNDDFDRPMVIFADNRANGTDEVSATEFNDGRRIATIYMGDGALDSTDAGNMHDILTDFNTSLSRQA